MSEYEEWRPVATFPDYSVSSLGRVVSHKRGKRHLMACPVSEPGYRRVVLYGAGASRTRGVHQLVAEAFLGPRPEGLVTRHIDGDSLNNTISNLAYGSHSENVLDSVLHGTHATAAKTHCPQGHPYDEANTFLKDGWRNCRTCKRIEALARYHRDKERPRRQRTLTKTHCKRGHLKAGENLYVRPDGRLSCRTCNLADSARWNAKRSAERATKRAAA